MANLSANRTRPAIPERNAVTGHPGFFMGMWGATHGGAWENPRGTIIKMSWAKNMEKIHR